MLETILTLNRHINFEIQKGISINIETSMLDPFTSEEVQFRDE